MTDPTPPSSQPAVDPALTARVKGILLQPKAEWLVIDREFATTNKIAYSTFCRWWRKYRSAPRRALARSNRSDEVRLVEVHVVDEIAASPAPHQHALELELPGGHPLRFEVGVDHLAHSMHVV